MDRSKEYYSRKVQDLNEDLSEKIGEKTLHEMRNVFNRKNPLSLASAVTRKTIQKETKDSRLLLDDGDRAYVDIYESEGN